ncbi:MAG: hypothetical protein CVV34_04170 [Methanomicrobiales archaeon HGW-Methanomicrobiales-5]|nr:MAG: hypothetical protein CVV34_04170 [Methanomicrobiales archaeon HGW-Methanomicrobiales-5]
MFNRYTGFFLKRFVQVYSNISRVFVPGRLIAPAFTGRIRQAELFRKHYFLKDIRFVVTRREGFLIQAHELLRALNRGCARREAIKKMCRNKKHIRYF